MKYFNYFKYVIRHKWFVMLECFRMGIIWQGVTHDISKFRLDEFIPYANHFYGSKDGIKKGRDETGYYKPTDTGDRAFDFAWFLHQKRNKHHWQWWVLPEDCNGVKILEIDYRYVKEMVCDWVGAGKAQGCFSPKNDPYMETRKWYRKNMYKLQLHPITRKMVEAIIGCMENV